MAFKEIKGQEKVIRILQREIANSSLPGAYLFVGPEGVGRKLTALTFAKVLNCEKRGMDSCEECSSCQKINHLNHPNVRIISGEEESIKIEQIRNLKREIGYKIYEGRKRVWIIEKAGKLSLEASNSLLKVLEEPPSDTLFILIVQTLKDVLPTIRSRCQIIHFSPLSSREIEKILRRKFSLNAQNISLIGKLSRGSMKEALLLARGDGVLKKREVILNNLRGSLSIEEIMKISKEWVSYSSGEWERMLNIILFWFRDLLMLKCKKSNSFINLDKIEELKKEREKYSFKKIKEILELIERVKFYLKSNVTPRLTFEYMWLKLLEEGEYFPP